jgi:hypothetical protein
MRSKVHFKNLIAIEVLNEIRVKFDQSRCLEYETIVQLFDKRQNIKGIRQMKGEFKGKRREALQNGRIDLYRKLVFSYKKLIEQRLESNLQLLARSLDITMKQVEQAQERHLNGADLTFVLGVEEFLSQSVPGWLSGEKAIEIYKEIKELTMQYVDTVSSIGNYSLRCRSSRGKAAARSTYTTSTMMRPM